MLKNLKRTTKIVLIIFSILVITFVFRPVKAATTYYYGDVDMDGQVTAADSRKILRAAVNLETLSASQKKLADMDGDGKITSSDARLALRVVVNLDPYRKYGTTINVTSIGISRSSGEPLVNEGGTIQLTATVSPSNATNKKVTWTSSNSSIASVDSNGKVTVKKAGTATIKATASNGKTGSTTLTITENKNSQLWWPIGSTQTWTINGKLFATGTPALGKDRIIRAGGSSNSKYIVDYAYVQNGKTGHHSAAGGWAVDINAGGKEGYYNAIAIGKGTVIGVNKNANNDWGNYVVVDYGNGIHAMYAHLYSGSIVVSQGETVDYGQVLGKVGNTGNSTGAHLHFAIGTYNQNTLSFVGKNSNGNEVDTTLYINPDNTRSYKYKVSFRY